MYYNDYEDYMRSVLGYNNINSNMPNMYNQDYYMSNNRMPCQMSTYQNDCSGNTMGESVEDLYPDIYKIVNPLVCKVCQNNTKPITNDLIEQMISQVYNSIKADDINIVNINIETGDVVNRETNNRAQENKDSKLSKEKIESRSSDETRNQRQNNPLLRDLIRILLLNRLFGNQRPMPRPPVRPPFPGGPGFPGPMPGPRPSMPRYEQYDQNIEVDNLQNLQDFQAMYRYGNYYNY